MRLLISLAVAAFAVIVQITIVDRIAFPGGTGPDVVLLTVAALALAGGPLAGALIGFLAGLALDIAPPGSHLVGQNALVFCLIGYACGLAAEEPTGDGAPEQGHTALFEIAVTAVGAVCGEVLASLLGTMLSDPRVTWPAIKHVLPVAAAYDVLLAPFVLYAVAAALRLAGTRGERSQAAWSGPAARPAVPGATQGAVRQVGTPNPSRLRLSDRGKSEGWISGVHGQGVNGRPAARREPRLNLGRGGSLAGSALAGKPPAKREPRLNLGRGGSLAASAHVTRSPARRQPRLHLGRGGPLAGSALAVRPPARREPRLHLGRGGSLAGNGLSAAFATGGGGSVKVRFGTRRGGGVLGGSLLGSAMIGTSSLRGTRFGRSRMGRSLLGGSVFSRSPSALSRSAPAGSSAALGRSSFRGSSFLGRTSFLGRSSFLSRPSTLGRPATSRRAAGRMRPASGATTARRVPRFSRGSTLTRLTAALRGSARSKTALGKSPGRGWVRRASPRRGGMGPGWTGGSAPRPRTGPTRLHMPRPEKKRKRRTGGYR